MPIDPKKPFDPEDDIDQGETDQEAAQRAQAARERAVTGQGRADDPAMAARGSGRTPGSKPDFSDPDDPSRKAGSYYPGEIAPNLAGEREKIDQATARLLKFIDKYARFATDKFYGYKAGTVKNTDPEAMKKLQAQYGKQKQYSHGEDVRSTSDMRVGKRGGVSGAEQMMDKNAAIELINQLPTMEQDKAFESQKQLYYFFHRAFKGARSQVKDVVHKDIDYQSKPRDVKKIDKEGNPYYVKEYDWETPEYEDRMSAAMEALEKEKTQVLADLNLLASASGTLKRASGRYGKADATALERKPRWKKPPEIVAKQPVTKLNPQMRGLAGPAPADPDPKAIGSTGAEPDRIAAAAAANARIAAAKDLNKPWWDPVSRNPPVPERPRPMGLPARGPIIRKKKQEAFDRYMYRIIEMAVADHSPTWLDEL